MSIFDVSRPTSPTASPATFRRPRCSVLQPGGRGISSARRCSSARCSGSLEVRATTKGSRPMHWRVKGLIQKGLSVGPGGKSLNDILQRSCGGLRNFESNVAAGVSNCTNSLLYLREVGFSVTGMVIVEIGTGWYPALPLCLSLAGARVIKTYDIIRHPSTYL